MALCTARMGLIKKDELAKEYARSGNSEAANNDSTNAKVSAKIGVALATVIAADKVHQGGDDGSAGGGGDDRDVLMDDANVGDDADPAAALAMSMEGGSNIGVSSNPTAGVGLPDDFRGNYRIFALVTHKGRSSDAGHYMVCKTLL